MELSRLILAELPFVKIKDEKPESLLIEVLVKAKPGSKKERIDKTDESLIVAVNARAIEGEANQRIVEFLAKSLGLAKRDVEIVSGDKGRNKRVILSFHFTEHKGIPYYEEKWKKLFEEMNS